MIPETVKYKTESIALCNPYHKVRTSISNMLVFVIFTKNLHVIVLLLCFLTDPRMIEHYEINEATLL